MTKTQRREANIELLYNDKLPPITKEQAVTLKYGQVIYERRGYNSDGSLRRWRVNGKVKTWKRNPERFEIPLKHGLYAYDTLTNYTKAYFTLEEGV